jgi:peroxiredoxin
MHEPKAAFMNPIFTIVDSCGGHKRLTSPTTAFAICLFSTAFLTNQLAADEPQPAAPQAPEFAGVSQWLNSNPLTIESLRGKVVVIHFWTFDCINCQHNLPYYSRWRHDFAEKDVQIIGVHTPETTDEADMQQLVSHVKQLGITYPVAVDGDHATWKAYNNRYWPSIYLIDKQGRIRYRWDGELENGDAASDKLIRVKIEALIAEPGL